MKTKLCQLCTQYTDKIKHYGWYTKDSKDYNTGKWITNLLICNSCINENANNITILSISALDEIPFKLKINKEITDLFHTK